MIKWIDNKKRKPKFGDEHLVVWNLKDGHYPVVSCMDWDAIKKVSLRLFRDNCTLDPAKLF